MDKPMNCQNTTMHDGDLLRKGAARLKAIVLGFALALAAISSATAAPLIINTDTSWLATNVQAAPTWNSDPSFNTTSWINATDLGISGCNGGASCIWYDGQFSSTRFVWLRKTFTISDPVLTASLIGGVDDDASIYLNGTLVFDEQNGFANNFGPIDIAALLVQGLNLIAVAASDNIPVHGQNHAFAASIRIETQNAVPEPGSLLLLCSGLAGLVLVRLRAKQTWRPKR